MIDIALKRGTCKGKQIYHIVFYPPVTGDCPPLYCSSAMSKKKSEKKTLYAKQVM